ncbi:MAG: hypothetical protein V4615_08665 [Bacteroidota bacterium]
MKCILTNLLFILSIPLYAESIKDTVILEDVVKVESISSSNSFQSPFTELKYQSGKRLSNVLSEFSSVYIKNYGIGQLASIAVRGTSATHTEIQWNGVKLNSPSLGQCDLSLFILGTQDELQLIRTGYRGTIGGTLRMSNTTKTDSGISANACLRVGSFKMLEGLGSTQYSKNRFSGTTNISYTTAENDFRYKNIFKEGHPYEKQKNAAVRQLSFLQQFGVLVNPDNEINLFLWLTEAERKLAPIMSKTEGKESQDDYSLRSMLSWKGKFKSLKLSFTSAFLQDGIRYVNPEALLDEASVMQALRNNFTTFYTFPFNLVLSGELNYDHERAKVRSYGESKTRNVVGFKFYSDYYIKNGLKFHLGFREDLIDKRLSAFAPELAVSFSKGSKNLKHLFITGILASRNFRFPTLNDLYWVPGGNRNLRQEKSWNGELRFKYKYQEFVDFSVSNFYIYVDDWIQWIPRDSTWWPVNLKRVFSRGAEVSIHATNDIGNTKRFVVHFNTSYTFTKTTNLDAASQFDESKGKQLIYVPIHRVVSVIQLQYYKFYFRSVNSYQSLVYTSTDNDQWLKGYFIADIEIGKDFSLGRNEIGLSFRVNNIADAQYQNVRQKPMQGRNFEGTLRFKLR